jgi:hypothetical protein
MIKKSRKRGIDVRIGITNIVVNGLPKLSKIKAGMKFLYSLPCVLFSLLGQPLLGSIGIAVFQQDGATMEMLIANADHALYKAKGNGSNTYLTYSY